MQLLGFVQRRTRACLSRRQHWSVQRMSLPSQHQGYPRCNVSCLSWAEKGLPSLEGCLLCWERTRSARGNSKAERCSSSDQAKVCSTSGTKGFDAHALKICVQVLTQQITLGGAECLHHWYQITQMKRYNHLEVRSLLSHLYLQGTCNDALHTVTAQKHLAAEAVARKVILHMCDTSAGSSILGTSCTYLGVLLMDWFGEIDKIAKMSGSASEICWRDCKPWREGCWISSIIMLSRWIDCNENWRKQPQKRKHCLKRSARLSLSFYPSFVTVGVARWIDMLECWCKVAQGVPRK